MNKQAIQQPYEAGACVALCGQPRMCVSVKVNEWACSSGTFPL